MVTYDQLKFKQRCIYQAFKAAMPAEDPANMGRTVNATGVDADDSRAVGILADHFGFNKCEVVHGSDFGTNFRLHANSKVIAVITPNGTMASRAPRVDENMDVSFNARDFLDKSDNSVVWHAIFGKVDGANTVTWVDEQKLNPNGPTANSATVLFTKFDSDG